MREGVLVLVAPPYNYRVGYKYSPPSSEALRTAVSLATSTQLTEIEPAGPLARLKLHIRQALIHTQ